MVDRAAINERWINCYAAGTMPWHLKDVNHFLKKYITTLTENKDVSGKRVLIPLCGKTVDMKFLYEQGLTVVGIELLDVAIQSFATENNMLLTAETKESYTIHTFDERLKIFQGDLFQFTPDMLGGLFDFWWDCGSLTAMVNEEDHKYMQLILSLMKTNSRGLITLFQYEPSVYIGRPKSINQAKVEEILDGKFEINQLACLPEDDLPKEHSARIGKGEVYHTLYLVKRISN